MSQSKKRTGKKRGRSKSEPPNDSFVLEEHQKLEIITTFQDALKDGETTLSISKAKKCLSILGLPTKTDELQTFFVGRDDDDYDTQPSVESLDETSFIRFATMKRIQVDKALDVFEIMDKDKKGIIVVEDLERIANDLEEGMTREELEEMIVFADGSGSGDGFLTPQDLIRIARKVNL